MAIIFDQQNVDDPLYRQMAENYLPAASRPSDVALHGDDRPPGYTEPVLHARRAAVKCKSKRV